MDRPTLTLGLGVMLLSGCSGKLFVSEPPSPPCTSLGCACSAMTPCTGGLECVGGHCVLSVCSSEIPAGACPSGRTCSSGVCVLDGAGGFCQCAPGQGCGRNGCEAINDTNGCSTSNPVGLCPLGQVCVFGACVVVEPSNECSATRPSGLCPAGAACDGGVCIPVADKACGPAHLDGLCLEGLVCVSPGICDYPPCSPQWPLGKCESGLFCSSKSTCIPLGSCAAQADCATHFVCTGGACVRDPTCKTTADCLTGEHCLASGQCAAVGKCGVTDDCDSGQVCSTLGNCLLAGGCETQADCASPTYCASNQRCLAPGQCGTAADCPPGQDCQASTSTCQPAGTLCTAGATDPTACPTGMRCSSLGSCIYNGSCTASSDCLTPYFTCSATYTCQPATVCPAATCPSGQTCSAAGGCVPTGNCVVPSDCPPGHACGPDFTCTPSSNCGNTQLGTTLVKPNMLVVLDRSGSMAACDAACDTRWNAATKAINTVLGAYSDRIRFGLSTFPHRCAGDTTVCGLTCTAQCERTQGCNDACPAGSSTQNCNPGVVDVAVQDATAVAITGALASNNPGGYTPTGATLRAILQNPGQYGLPDPADPVSRSNYVLLVTDGEPNCDTHAAARVEGYLDSLRRAGIKTYVVGITTGGSTFTTLNCFAVFGGTSTCTTQVTANACSGSPLECSCKTVTGNTTPCFFKATDQAALSSAFDTIIGSVASCSYTLSAVPPQLTQLYVYLQAAGTTTLTAVPQNSGTETNGWTWLPAASQLQFSGSSCTALKSGTASPVIYYGCSTGG